MRRNAPFEPRTNGMLETFFHAGDLDFKPPELDALLELAKRVPTVLVLHLERPAVIPELWSLPPPSPPSQRVPARRGRPAVAESNRGSGAGGGGASNGTPPSSRSSRGPS